MNLKKKMHGINQSQMFICKMTWHGFDAIMRSCSNKGNYNYGQMIPAPKSRSLTADV